MSRGSKFERDTAVEPLEGRDRTYGGLLLDDWCTGLVPQGGLVSAVALRAMQFELGQPDHRLRSVTTVFAAPVREGPIEIEVTVLRRGRSMSQLQATLRNVGEPAGHTSLAVFGTSRPGFEFTELAPPAVKPPDACPSFRDDPPEGWPVNRRRFEFWNQIEGRAAIGHAPWEEWVPESSDCAFWYRYDDPPRLPDGTLDPLAVVTLCDMMPGVVSERMGPMPEQWFAPSADLTVHLAGPATSEWLLACNRAHHAGDGYASAQSTLWDPASGLVAHATQVMFFAFAEGLPPPERRRPPT